MRKHKWVVAALALALLTGGGVASYAQPAEGAGAKAGKQGKAGKGARAGRGAGRARGGPQMQIKMLEDALGAPLTAQQRQDVEAAHKTYMDNVAKAVGLTPEQLQEKVREARRKAREARGAGKAAKQ